MLIINGHTYLTTSETADYVGYALQTFHNRRSREGDSFIRGHELVPGRLFYRVVDVQRIAKARAE